MIEVKNVNADKQILDRIIEIDKTFYKDFDYENNKSWYYDRYTNKPFTVLCVDGVIVGYFCFYPVTQQLFNQIRNGEHSGDYDFSLEDVYVTSKYYYLVSVLVLQEYRGSHTKPLLIELQKQTEKLENLVAIAISKDGERICGKFMKKCCELKDCSIYIK